MTHQYHSKGVLDESHQDNNINNKVSHNPQADQPHEDNSSVELVEEKVDMLTTSDNDQVFAGMAKCNEIALATLSTKSEGMVEV